MHTSLNLYIKNVLVITACILELFNLFIYIKSHKYRIPISGLKVFILEKHFYFGYWISNFLKIKSQKEMRRRKHLMEIYDFKKSDEVSKSATYAPYTYIAIFSPIFLLIVAVAENLKLIFLFVFFLGFMCFYFDIWLSRKLKIRHTEILCEYATVLTKMSLLVNAGITASESFERVAFSNEGLLYKEMQKTVLDIRNGVSYGIALNELAVRGGCKEVKKFVSLYKQNLIKGGPEFPYLLSEMADNVWCERKGRARLASTSASQKLLLPILMMFIGVLLMVIVPAFENLL